MKKDDLTPQMELTPEEKYHIKQAKSWWNRITRKVFTIEEIQQQSAAFRHQEQIRYYYQRVERLRHAEKKAKRLIKKASRKAIKDGHSKCCIVFGERYIPPSLWDDLLDKIMPEYEASGYAWHTYSFANYQALELSWEKDNKIWKIRKIQVLHLVDRS